jgi:MFS family permease
LLLAIVFFTTFASSMVSGSAVYFLIKSLAGTEETRAEFIGITIAVSSLALIAGSFAGGFLVDRIGKRSPFNLLAISACLQESRARYATHARRGALVIGKCPWYEKKFA